MLPPGSGQARGRACNQDNSARCVESAAVRREPAGVAALVLAAAALGHALVSAAREGWTYDEPIHLQWSERFLESGVTERASQERFNSKTPIMVPGVLARKAARALGVQDEAASRFAARLPTAAWLAALLALVWAAGRAIGPPCARARPAP